MTDDCILYEGILRVIDAQKIAVEHIDRKLTTKELMEIRTYLNEHVKDLSVIYDAIEEICN